MERRLLLFLADQSAVLVAIGLSGVVGAAVSGGEIAGLFALLALAVVWWVSASAFDCYDIRRVANPARSVVGVWCAVAVMATAIGLFDLAVGTSVTLASAGSFMLISVVLAAPMRAAYAFALTRPQARRKALIVGDALGIAEAVDVLTSDAAAEYEVVATYSADHADDGVASPAAAQNPSLPMLVLMYGADEIVVAATDDDEAATEAVNDARNAHPQVVVRHFAGLYEELRGRVPVRYVCPHWWTMVEGRTSTLALFIKRSIDVVVSAVALAVLSPVFLLVAAAIKLDSPGPIIYKQEREGVHGRPFTMLKFRSMVVGAEVGEAVWERPSDPRRTRVGKILRRLHLDEGPQLINVIAGSMSLVGPRPERSHFVTQLAKAAPAYRHRMLMRPGITGWAQVRFGYARSVEDSIEKLEHDLYYVKNWSPFLDFVIALKTVGSLVRRTVSEPVSDVETPSPISATSSS